MVPYHIVVMIVLIEMSAMLLLLLLITITGNPKTIPMCLGVPKTLVVTSIVQHQ
jgi:hypothetical protein